MKLEEIKSELKGYFIYKNGTDYELGLKKGKDFELITDNINILTFTDRFEVTPIRYLLMQINNNILDPSVYVTDLSEVLPIIDFQLFRLYDKRNEEIDRHKALLKKIQESKSIFGKKNDYKLISVTSHNFLDSNKDQKGYYVIKDSEAVPIDSTLLDDVSKAVEINHLQDLRKALKDDLNNQYSEIYKEQCRLWDSLN